MLPLASVVILVILGISFCLFVVVYTAFTLFVVQQEWHSVYRNPSPLVSTCSVTKICVEPDLLWSNSCLQCMVKQNWTQ